MGKHKFHIPVMGIGFTVDSPAKVAPYGISSVLSLVDDILLDKVRKHYSEKLSVPFQEITKSVDDFRAKRVTAYLDTIQDFVDNKFTAIKSSAFEVSSEITKYFEMLPEDSKLKKVYQNMIGSSSDSEKEELQRELRENMTIGSIDVNIMTKLDRTNYKGKEILPIEYNDAHAALRGYANSKAKGSIVFSAGMNKKLYSYLGTLEEFLPQEDFTYHKSVILKVSDYRSALTQGKLLAKKGIWVSEYRIESGLNCGGHAFATDGLLIGSILKEFAEGRDALDETIFGLYIKGLEKREAKYIPNVSPGFKVSAQGGVGNSEEQNFLIDTYGVDSVGWGSPFLLTPEATSVDEYTRKILREAKEEDLFLSDISPLGVPFNSVKNSSKELEKLEWIKKGTPGSTCPKGFLVSTTEFTDKPLCTAARSYQKLKGRTLDKNSEEYKTLLRKECICVGLGVSPLLNYDLDRKMEGDTVSVCPGPNIAYYGNDTSLKEMVSHIYGKDSINVSDNRPNFLIKELDMYIDELEDRVRLGTAEKKIETFIKNLKDGIEYYKILSLGEGFKSLLDIKIDRLDRFISTI